MPPASVKGRAKPARFGWWVAIVAVVVVVAIVAGVFVATRPHSPRYRVAAASTGAVEQTLDSTGTIVPATEAEMNFGTSGAVSTVTATVGEKVTASSTLATLQAAPLTTALTAAQAALTLAESQLSSARAGTDPPNQPSGGGPPGAGVTASEVDQLQATVDGDVAQVDQARSALAAATLVSPITGTVAAVTLAPGRTVSATSSAVISPGAATASAEVVVVSGGAPEVATSVGVAQYGLLAVGQVAGVVPDGSATLLRGTVASVGLTPTQSNGSTTYTVTIALASGTVQPLGSSAGVAITVREAAHAVRVPSSAVHFLGGSTLVDELRGNQVLPVPVIVGAIGATYTQIVRGLAPGTRVVLANLNEKVPSASSSKPQGFIGTRIQIFHGKGGGQSVVVEGGRAGF